VARGIPANKIFLAGFSQGCAMTLQTGLRYPQNWQACVSGYVPLRDVAAERSESDTPVFLVHGRRRSCDSFNAQNNRATC
jgi:phospholipase/carboxylesterase